MVASGQVDVKPLVTHRFKLEDSIQAFEAAKRGDGIKVMISCDRSGQEGKGAASRSCSAVTAAARREKARPECETSIH